MIKAAMMALVFAGPAYASEGSRDVRLLSADQVGSCTGLATVTETRADGSNPDNAAQKALSTAMDKAAKAGANAAVIADGPPTPKHQTIILKTYKCSDAVGLTPAS